MQPVGCASLIFICLIDYRWRMGAAYSGDTPREAAPDTCRAFLLKILVPVSAEFSTKPPTDFLAVIADDLPHMTTRPQATRTTLRVTTINTYASRSLGPRTTTVPVARSTHMSGEIEARSLSGCMIDLAPPAQSQEPQYTDPHAPNRAGPSLHRTGQDENL